MKSSKSGYDLVHRIVEAWRAWDECTSSRPPSPEEMGHPANSVLTVNVFVDSPIALRGYQTALDVSGGSAGTLSLESLVVTDTRTDFVFHTLSDVPAIDNGNARVASALFSGAASGSPSKYLATYTYRASSNAAGTFTISIRTEDTMLRDENSGSVNWEVGDVAEVTVE
ncbi:MAG: hypothetical protein AABZ47_14790 [Planctomycetota bacterium]